MKCPECLAEDQTSKVYDHGCTSTLMGGGEPFWDEEGVRHVHDPNTITDCFRCSKGHYWATKRKRVCPLYGSELA